MSSPCRYYDNSTFWTFYPMRQEIGCHRRKHIGYQDMLCKKIYQAMSVTKDSIYDVTLSDTCNRSDKNVSTSGNNSNAFHGGIFNLSFSPNGSILVAATQRKSLILFDPLTHSVINKVTDAHLDSVNYVRFLDDKIFATCSDDTNVALWDMRMLKNRIQLLEGHSYWVKNIEYDERKRLLLTSSYDGSVRLWDVFNSTQCGGQEEDQERRSSCPSQRLLHLSCIMRMRVTNDASKMILCTSEGYMMIIHDLNLETLQEDLKPFQSDLYRLMQKGHSCGFDFGSWCNHLFTAKRNRVELISDFPQDDEAHSITSLDVHPHSWSILTRNITKDDSKEWTCVHDIQDDVRPWEQLPMKLPYEPAIHRYDAPSSALSRFSSNLTPQSNLTPSSGFSSNLTPQSNLTPSSGFSNNLTPQLNPVPSSALEMHVSPVVIISSRAQNRRSHATILNPSTSYREIDRNDVPLIFKNVNRLTHYSPELNVGSGYIKELNYSPDGRVIVSPYEFGYRILAFNQSCSEASDFQKSCSEASDFQKSCSEASDFNQSCSEASDFQSPKYQPQELVQVKRLLPHANHVVVAKFSPTTALIASGCLSGRVVFSQPVL